MSYVLLLRGQIIGPFGTRDAAARWITNHPIASKGYIIPLTPPSIYARRK